MRPRSQVHKDRIAATLRKKGEAQREVTWAEHFVPGPPDKCWEWTGTRFQGSGYGRIGNLRAHTMSWEKANGRAVPADMFVCHHCDNPPCVNPAHLYVGTHADNTRDRMMRERGIRGARVNTAKLKSAQVQEIRWLRDHDWNSYDVATAYGIAQPMCCLIGRREAWAWLPERPRKPAAAFLEQIQVSRTARLQASREGARRKKSAASRGTGNWAAKLTEAQVYEVRQLHAQGWVQQDVANAYGIQQAMVSSIGRRASWAHLPEAA